MHGVVDGVSRVRDVRNVSHNLYFVEALHAFTVCDLVWSGEQKHFGILI